MRALIRFYFRKAVRGLIIFLIIGFPFFMYAGYRENFTNAAPALIIKFAALIMLMLLVVSSWPNEFPLSLPVKRAGILLFRPVILVLIVALAASFYLAISVIVATAKGTFSGVYAMIAFAAYLLPILSLLLYLGTLAFMQKTGGKILTGLGVYLLFILYMFLAIRKVPFLPWWKHFSMPTLPSPYFLLISLVVTVSFLLLAIRSASHFELLPAAEVSESVEPAAPGRRIFLDRLCPYRCFIVGSLRSDWQYIFLLGGYCFFQFMISASSVTEGPPLLLITMFLPVISILILPYTLARMGSLLTMPIERERLFRTIALPFLLLPICSALVTIVIGLFVPFPSPEYAMPGAETISPIQILLIAGLLSIAVALLCNIVFLLPSIISLRRRHHERRLWWIQVSPFVGPMAVLFYIVVIDDMRFQPILATLSADYFLPICAPLVIMCVAFWKVAERAFCNLEVSDITGFDKKPRIL